ncbi:dephospho-CoA kinase [Bacillus sp. FJAT-27916]|uniref:dephospho-CoA kinase n=1 Tax=Bacillus sp. FJAT-27916 TaxID=1679169 RepID=UPI0006711396|nr:dephospho-CoA kinase [Bacillus sp. FJAT-27916]KMY46331.1 dephospho-CoA kinase [Bacillus sp. FJAT-27916]
MKKIIGLTGGIASGKSTVSNWLLSQGYPVVDADIAARKVVEPGMPALEKIRKAFGDDVLLPDGTLDRKRLGSIIFANEEKRQTLNAIVHPAVREWMRQETERAFGEGASIVIMDIPLLFESKLTHMVEETILIYVTKETQLKRLMERDGYMEADALARIHAQMPIDEKKELADYIVDNNGPLSETIEQMKQIMDTFK